MPVTRSSRKQKRGEDVEERKVEQSEDEPEQDSKTTKDLNGQRSRELRRKQRETMRSRNMGVGISISTESTPSKKIIFDDENEGEEESVDENGIDEIEPIKEVVSQGEDSDDDAVEEVKSSVARQTIMEQLAKERETVKIQKLQTRTKKRKKTSEKKQPDEEEFDEEFFAQVDSELEAQRRQKKKKEKGSDSGPAGRHTTFVSVEDDETAGPIQANHNIELVVLGDEGPVNSALMRIMEAKAGIEPSDASHLFARSRLENGTEQAKKKGSKRKKQDDAGWKRSKKMNVLAFGHTKMQRRKGRGMAAARFVVKS